MRAGLLVASLAVVAAPAPAFSEIGSSRKVACAAPTLLQCSIVAPGFTNWIIAPFGLAPSDAEIAAQACRTGVVSAKRRPPGEEIVRQTTVVDVICGTAPTEARRAPPIRTPAVERAALPDRARTVERTPVLAGSPQDFEPDVAPRRRSPQASERPPRAERLSERSETRRRVREPDQDALPSRVRQPVEDRVAAPTVRPGPIAAPERLPEPPPPAPATAADVRPEPPRSETPPSPPAPSTPRPAPPSKWKDDPSISYDHF
ncbi:hypothetical protein [Chenggangzhangella methanolivorans]|uniref:Uncharacterized protein n=1 Tax=Chenggangzhangella methanolivorans TaxID=1437009 RepID=A0A9E6RA61_9HYPH|nr:hypothetical protein [Chenggangzhangella methanolivorans]QZO00105.1 hypothetical protein K6K41_26725 [Chenggangzhangella methanolivorans]